VDGEEEEEEAGSVAVVVLLVDGSITIAIPSNRTCTTSDTPVVDGCAGCVDGGGGDSSSSSFSLDGGGCLFSMAAVTFEAVFIPYFKALHAKEVLLALLPLLLVFVLLDEYLDVLVVVELVLISSTSSSTNRISICMVRMVKRTMVILLFKNCDAIYSVLNDTLLNI
jgi:hypothetical protein